MILFFYKPKYVFLRFYYFFLIITTSLESKSTALLLIYMPVKTKCKIINHILCLWGPKTLHTREKKPFSYMLHFLRQHTISDSKQEILPFFLQNYHKPCKSLTVVKLICSLKLCCQAQERARIYSNINRGITLHESKSTALLYAWTSRTRCKIINYV